MTTHHIFLIHDSLLSSLQVYSRLVSSLFLASQMLSNRFFLHWNGAEMGNHGDKRAKRTHGLHHFTGEGELKDFRTSYQRDQQLK